jgi:hypothetical protein
MTGDREPGASLDALRARLDTLAGGEDRDGACWTAHVAVLDRLARMRRAAETRGWTSLALERDGASEGLRLFGIPPGGTLRSEVPEPPGDGAP